MYLVDCESTFLSVEIWANIPFVIDASDFHNKILTAPPQHIQTLQTNETRKKQFRNDKFSDPKMHFIPNTNVQKLFYRYICEANNLTIYIIYLFIYGPTVHNSCTQYLAFSPFFYPLSFPSAFALPQSIHSICTAFIYFQTAFLLSLTLAIVSS